MKKVVFGNYSYLSEKLHFFQNFVFLSVFILINLLGISIRIWMKGSETHLTNLHVSAYLEANSTQVQISIV